MDALDEAYARAQRDVDSVQRALLHVGDPEALARVKASATAAINRLATAQKAFDELAAQRAAQRKAKADADRAAWLAEAQMLERRASELRKKANDYE